MKPYGIPRCANEHCTYHCCVYQDGAKKYSRHRAKPRTDATDRDHKRGERAEAKRQIEKEACEAVED